MLMAILAPHLFYQGLLPFAEGREGQAVATYAWSLPDCHMCRHDLAKHGELSYISVNTGAGISSSRMAAWMWRRCELLLLCCLASMTSAISARSGTRAEVVCLEHNQPLLLFA